MKDFKLNIDKKTTTGFTTPDNYFETLSDKIISQLPNEEIKVISFFSRNKKWLFTAAAVLVIALSIPIVYQLQNKEEELTANEMESYLVNHSTISDDDIINLLEQEDIDNLKINTPVTSETIEEVLSNNSDIEQYITNEN